MDEIFQEHWNADGRCFYDGMTWPCHVQQVRMELFRVQSELERMEIMWNNALKEYIKVMTKEQMGVQR